MSEHETQRCPYCDTDESEAQAIRDDERKYSLDAAAERHADCDLA